MRGMRGMWSLTRKVLKGKINPVIRGEYVSVDIEKTFEHWCLLLEHLLIFLGEEYKIFQELD